MPGGALELGPTEVPEPFIQRLNGTLRSLNEQTKKMLDKLVVLFNDSPTLGSPLEGDF